MADRAEAGWSHASSSHGRKLVGRDGALHAFRRQLARDDVGSMRFHCDGARDPQTARDLTELWSDHALLKDAQIELRMDGSSARYVVVESDETKT